MMICDRLVEQERKYEMELDRGPGLIRPLPKRGLPPSKLQEIKCVGKFYYNVEMSKNELKKCAEYN